MKKHFHVEFKVEADGIKRQSLAVMIGNMIQQGKGFTPIESTVKVINRSQGGAKSKGAGRDYELRVAKSLGEWWCGKPFRRTPNSGGWDKQVNDGEIKAAGDLIAPDDAHFPFCVECKHRKEPVNFFAESTGEPDSSTLIDWWKQCAKEAESVRKMPLLVFQCGRTEYVGFRAVEIQSLFDPIITDTKRRLKLLIGGDYMFTVMLYSDFISINKPQCEVFNKDQITRSNVT